MSKNIKSQREARRPKGALIGRHCQRTSNHNFGPSFKTSTVIGRHCQRTSNHNGKHWRGFSRLLVAIVKEHQITTRWIAGGGCGRLVAIVKEHQITTEGAFHAVGVRLVAIVKEHQITTAVSGIQYSLVLVAIVKEHQQRGV